MTEPTDHLAEALHLLRGEVCDQIPVPSAAGLRARAIHRLRVRRATTVVVAAAAVAVVAVGGNTLLRPTAAPPAPPADTPTPAPVTPSPRPAPQPPDPVDDPITEVDWGSATIDLPPHDGCPSGPVTLTPVSDIYPNGVGPADEYPYVALDATDVAYGDLTGDGRIEAVLSATCYATPEDESRAEELIHEIQWYPDYSGHRQLLVVTRTDDGTLTGLGWMGPSALTYLSYWISDGRLLVDADPGSGTAGSPSAPLPGLALAYRWDGSSFVGGEPAPEYPAILPFDGEQPAAPVQPGAVAGGLGCPDAELRFTQAGKAPADGATYTIHGEPLQGYLFDLDPTAGRLLVVGLQCDRTDGTVGRGLAVFERAGDGWQGTSVLTAPEGSVAGVWLEPDPEVYPEDTVLVIHWTTMKPNGETGEPNLDSPTPYRWTGTVLEPVDEEAE